MLKIGLEFGMEWLVVVTIGSVSFLSSAALGSPLSHLILFPLIHVSSDFDMEFVMFRFVFRHRQSWQYASRININRADLLRFIYELSLKLGIQYDMAIPSRRIIIDEQTNRRFDAATAGVLQDDNTSLNRGVNAGTDSLIGTGPLH